MEKSVRRKSIGINLKIINKKSIRPLPIFGRMALSKGQEKALDELWSKAVKARANNMCETCLRSGIRLESHHFYGRKNKHVRHIVSNGFSLCHMHHRWAEEQPAEFIEWAIHSRGQKWYDYLEIQARELKIWKEYSVIKAYLTSFL